MAETVTCPRCGTPVAAGARFCSSCGAALGEVPREERRIVTVLFGDLAGFTEWSERVDAEQVKGIVDRAFEGLAEIVTLYGGRVDKVLGDEIMAVFGAPQAHEDDAERAVRAALEMQRSLARFGEELPPERAMPLRMHIGVNTGEVLAGTIGGSEQYTVLGDAVNTARRIEDAAEPGQVLVGPATEEATRQAIVYRRIGDVTAKGKRLPVPVWEAIGERALPGTRPPRAAPLVGREEELTLLDSLGAIVRRDRRPVVVTVVGEAGMGKSRLATEFARRAHLEGMRVLHGRSLPYGTAAPAFAVQEIVRAVLVLDPGMTAEHAREHLRRGDLPAAEAEAVLALLGLGGQVPAREASTAGPGSVATAATATATAPLLEAAASLLERIAVREGGLVIVFQELHWAEEAVLDLIRERLARARAPLLVLCLARPDLLERRPDWSTGIGTAVLPLDPLPRDRAETLLDVLAPSLTGAVREDVLDRAGGNPFYLEELSRLLVDKGAGAIAVPVSIHAVVTARLDALAPEEKAVLQDAAVVGEQFWPGAIERLRGADEKAALGALEAREFVEPGAPSLGGEPGYRFRQRIVREVAYTSVPKQVRARQHEQVAAWLEEVAGAERHLLDLIAHHYESAAALAREVGSPSPGAEAKAVAALERAGGQALALDAAAVAAGFFDRALALASGEGDRLRLQLLLGEARVGDWRRDAAAPLEDALAVARALGDRAAEGKALRLLSDLYRMQGETGRAREPLTDALAIARETGDEREEAEGLRSHGLLELVQGRWGPATTWFLESLGRYRALGDRRGEGWSLQNLGWASLLLGRFDDALAYLDEGARLFAELGDLEGAGWCMTMRAWTMLIQGDVSGAEAIARGIEEQILTGHARLASGFELAMQRILLSYAAVLRGRLVDAERLSEAALAGDQGAHWVRAMALFPRFLVALMRLRPADARAVADEGSRAAEAAGDPLYRAQWAFARARIAIEDGRVADAERAAEEHATLAEGEGVGADHRWITASALRARGRPQEARALLERDTGHRGISLVPPAQGQALLAEIMTDQGDAEGAVAAAAEAVRGAGEDLVGRSAALAALARARLTAGDASGAEAAAREGLSVLEGSDWDVQRVRALALLARALDGGRRFDESAEATDRARALIASMPPGTDVARLEALLHG